MEQWKTYIFGSMYECASFEDNEKVVYIQNLCKLI